MNHTSPQNHLQPHSVRTIYGVPACAEALALAQLAKDAPAILHVSANDRAMNGMAEALQFFAPHMHILRLAAWDTMPYDRASPKTSLMAERMHILSLLASGTAPAPFILLTTAAALLQKLPPKQHMAQARTELKAGSTYPQHELIAYLTQNGYRRVGKAMEPGEFARRGSIMDVIPPGETHGMRMDWFGDEIDSIRSFDPFNQISLENRDRVTLHPVSEVMLNEETIRQFRQQYRNLFGAVSKEDPLYEAVSSGQPYPGMEHWLPLFYEHTHTIMEYCPPATPLVMGQETQQATQERQESIEDYYQARQEALNTRDKKNRFAAAIYHAVPPQLAFVMQKEWEAVPAHNPLVEFVAFSATSGKEDFGLQSQLPLTSASSTANPFDTLQQHMAQGSAAHTLIACHSTGSLKRLHTLLSERNFRTKEISRWPEIQSLPDATIGLAVLPLERGFKTQDVSIFSEQDVLGERITRTQTRRKKSDIFLQEAASFNEGEAVVHKEHGIGQFEGLVAVEAAGARHDCLKLVYEGGDKLFLPVENIDMVSRYGMEDEQVRLDKLGGTSWQMRKARLKERIKLAAEALLKTAAQRQLSKADILPPASSYQEFIARFPYAETEDQGRSIDDVIQDMQSGTPMDRLICGDVGFGKTEVALRAAYIAVTAQEKVQVAVITPTTLLARQHTQNFIERFAGFPVTIRQLSRMVPASQQKKTREALAEGTVDIVIGTHALLSKQTQFKNLGLLIVDEEQHFGVGQKEKLKELKAGVHVLTLSATPIPRTLQMALTGVRDLSLITTPPVDRLAIRSFVMPFDPVVIREAVMREIHRGGQCFVVTPRIKYMAELKAQLKELLPEARLATAHGQMAPGELDKIMNGFYDGEFDILLSTAIIESGLDIPRANTIIIHNAHLFGLSQLYQMRGRVGRGKLRAYAYFLLPHHRELTKNATRRLEVMNTLDTLGAGFTLASHDMDIRGFGNLVGEEQSGHIREVGVELYQHMLEEAVEKLKRESGKENRENIPDSQFPVPDSSDWSPQINLGLSVLIPESYIEDLSLRMGLYRRAAHFTNEDEINSFAAELTDRFGPPPEETQSFIATLGIKILCKQAGIERIDTGPKGAVLSFRNDTFVNPEALLSYLDKHTRSLRPRPDQKIVYSTQWDSTEEKLADIKRLAGEIAALTTG